MQKRAALAGIVVVVIVAAVVLSRGTHSAKHVTPDLAAKLSLNQLIGQRITTGYIGAKVPKGLLAAVRLGQVGGVILFADNVPNRTVTLRATSQLQRSARIGRQPRLLIMVDQEGGEVKRLKWAPPTHSAAAIGRSGDVNATASKEGRLTGLSLKKVGIDVDLAPVADVPDASDSFLGTRAFSRDPATVAAAACAFAAGVQQVPGEATVFKHFPGLGRAGANTDFGDVVVSASAALIQADLSAYKRCPTTPKLVMISTAKYPGLEINVPAALAPATFDLLSQTGFKGVTITDAFDTPTIKHQPHVEGRAITAGVDILLYGQLQRGRKLAYSRLLADARGGKFRVSELRAAANKILTLKAQLGGA